MKYARDTRPNGASTQSADVLVEALPWIKNITGKTVVIKYGGSAMVDEKLRADVMSDIVLLKIIGVNPVIVHGGGHAITEAMERFQLRWSSRTASASPPTRPWTWCAPCSWAR